MNPVILTRRETQVVELYASGLGTKEIAAKIGIARKTVDVHRLNAIRKAGAETLCQLTLAAIRAHLIDLGTLPRINLRLTK